MFFKRFQNAILTPRLWLSAGVFCFGISVILGYHQDQVNASNVLAEKVKLPSTVVIQDFDPGRHSNLLHEVQLLAEAALAQTVTLNIGSLEAPNWVQILPIYPVGADSKPFADKHLAAVSGNARRPKSRAESAAMASDAQQLLAIESQPMGMLLIESGTSIEDAVLFRSLGEGSKGPLVETTGSLLIGDEIRQIATQAFSNDNLYVMADIPLIVPYPNGMRIVGPVEDYSTLRSVLEWVALLMVVFGAAQVFSIFKPRSRRPKLDTFQQVEAVGAFPGVFQAIRTQEDLIREEQEASEREASATRRTLSRLKNAG